MCTTALQAVQVHPKTYKRSVLRMPRLSLVLKLFVVRYLRILTMGVAQDVP